MLRGAPLLTASSVCIKATCMSIAVFSGLHSPEHDSGILPTSHTLLSPLPDTIPDTIKPKDMYGARPVSFNGHLYILGSFTKTVSMTSAASSEGSTLFAVPNDPY